MQFSENKDTNLSLKNKVSLGNILHKKETPTFAKINVVIDGFEKSNGITTKKNSFPIEIFTPQIQQLINDAAANGYCKEYVAASILTTLSVAIGNNIDLEIMTNSWNVKCAIWLAIVGRSGFGKTPALNIGLRPLRKIDSELQKEVSYLDDKQEKPLPTKDAIVNDTTIEALMSALSISNKGILCFNDEIVGLLKQQNRYKKGNDVEAFLSFWSCVATKVNRVSKEKLFIESPFVSILGGIQPKILQDMAANNGDSNGMLYRFLFVFDNDYIRPEWNESNISFESIKEYESTIREFYFKAHRHTFVFSAEAKEVWRKFYNSQNKKINASKHDNNKVCEYLPKLIDYCARFAIIIQCLQDAEKVELSKYITSESLQKAIKLTAYFEQNAKKAYQIIEKNSVPEIVELAAEYYKKGLSFRKVAEAILPIKKVSHITVRNWVKKYPSVFNE